MSIELCFVLTVSHLTEPINCFQECFVHPLSFARAPENETQQTHGRPFPKKAVLLQTVTEKSGRICHFGNEFWQNFTILALFSLLWTFIWQKKVNLWQIFSKLGRLSGNSHFFAHNLQFCCNSDSLQNGTSLLERVIVWSIEVFSN